MNLMGTDFHAESEKAVESADMSERTVRKCGVYRTHAIALTWSA